MSKKKPNMDKVKENISDKKKALLEALETSLGNVFIACKIAGVSRSRHYDYMDEYPQYAKKVKKIQARKDNNLLDLAEWSLVENLKEKRMDATRYVLDNKGKKRGYNVPDEVESYEGNNQIIVNIRKEPEK
jgi:hypothetical protein